MAAPSPGRKPDRFLSHGRTASLGSSATLANAFILRNAPRMSGSNDESDAPTKATSHAPWRIRFAPWMAAITPVAQAAIGARLGPLKQKAWLTRHAPRFGPHE